MSRLMDQMRETFEEHINILKKFADRLKQLVKNNQSFA